jgi:hypothetical protein
LSRRFGVILVVRTVTLRKSPPLRENITRRAKPPLLSIPTMPPQRRALTSISPNITSRKQLTIYKRGQIIGAYQAGLIYTQIAKQFNTPRSTIRDTINYAPNRPIGAVENRSGRPKSTTERDERFLLRYIRLHPKATYK